MLRSEGGIEAVLRNEISAVAAALRPGAMIGAPVVVAIIPQRCVTLPSAISSEASLLLPYSGLFLSALRRRLFESLRLLRLGRCLLATLLHAVFIVSLFLL